MWVLEVVVLMYLCHSTYLALSFLHLHLYIIFFLGKFKSTIIDALRIFVAIYNTIYMHAYSVQDFLVLARNLRIYMTYSMFALVNATCHSEHAEPSYNTVESGHPCNGTISGGVHFLISGVSQHANAFETTVSALNYGSVLISGVQISKVPLQCTI